MVLLDEIEKAHREVFNLFLQLFEDGRLTDSKGRHVDFKNTIIIMTTNIGAAEITGKVGGYGFHNRKDEQANYAKMKDTVKVAMENNFRPEFLNRVDDIIVFRPLTKENISNIIEIELAKVFKRLKEKGLKLVLSDDARELLIEKGTSLDFGARPLRRAIEHYLEDPLSEELLKGTFFGKNLIHTKVVSADGEKRVAFDCFNEEEEKALVGAKNAGIDKAPPEA